MTRSSRNASGSDYRASAADSAPIIAGVYLSRRTSGHVRHRGEFDAPLGNQAFEIAIEKGPRFWAIFEAPVHVCETEAARRGARLRFRAEFGERSHRCTERNAGSPVELGIAELAAQVPESEGLVRGLRAIGKVQMTGARENDKLFGRPELVIEVANILDVTKDPSPVNTHVGTRAANHRRAGAAAAFHLGTSSAAEHRTDGERRLRPLINGVEGNGSKPPIDMRGARSHPRSRRHRRQVDRQRPTQGGRPGWAFLADRRPASRNRCLAPSTVGSRSATCRRGINGAGDVS